MKKLLLATVATSLILSYAAYAQEPKKDVDDHDSRLKQAELLMKVSPPQDLVSQLIDGLAKNPRAQLSAEDIASIKSSIDYTVLGKAMQEGLVKTFTVDELKMMTELYGSPTGRSIIHKMPAYMADIGPALQSQVQTHVMDFMKKKQQQQVAPAPAASTPAPAPEASAPAAPAPAPAAAATPATPEPAPAAPAAPQP